MERCSICAIETNDLYECYMCKRDTCINCCRTQYLNFSYWDGNVDIVEECDVCSCVALTLWNYSIQETY